MTQELQPKFSIHPAIFPDNKSNIISLLDAYIAWMPAHLQSSSQLSINTDIEDLPGKYATESGGGIWLAFISSPFPSSNSNDQILEASNHERGEAVGIICLRNLASKRSVGQTLTADAEVELGDAVSDALSGQFQNSGTGREDERRGNEKSRKKKKRTCEIKRLFATIETRGLGIGMALMKTVIREARELGYEEMLLDTAVEAVEAISLYEKFGFVRFERYSQETSGFVFMKLDLSSRKAFTFDELEAHSSSLHT